MGLWVYLLIVFLLWLLYLELSPQLGKIWIRPNEKGGWRLSLGGVIQLMGKPFTQIEYWYPRFWDLNIYVWWILTLLVYWIFK
jgi:hypothetical protein